jgi:hypothetical protein
MICPVSAAVSKGADTMTTQHDLASIARAVIDANS